jgi:hypothetical protein
VQAWQSIKTPGRASDSPCGVPSRPANVQQQTEGACDV